MKKVAILRFGTIGSGVYEILDGRDDCEVVKVLDLRDLKGTPAEFVATKNFDDIIASDADIVVETMGGVHPAYEFTKTCLEAGKSVVTSNKAVVAPYRKELKKLAADRGVKYFYEASVGGGIPIIRVIEECLECDEVVKITGILNGTTNYILTSMAESGLTFDDALKNAQKLGYAEADPSADIEGWDTCRKISILASIISGRTVDFEKVPCEGIKHITAADIEAAKKEDKKIKLIGYAMIDNDDIKIGVSPVEIGEDSMLYGVDGVMNAIQLESKYLGKSMYYGAGAGKLATATAVVADILHV